MGKTVIGKQNASGEKKHKKEQSNPGRQVTIPFTKAVIPVLYRITQSMQDMIAKVKELILQIIRLLGLLVEPRHLSTVAFLIAVLTVFFLLMARSMSLFRRYSRPYLYANIVLWVSSAIFLLAVPRRSDKNGERTKTQ